MIKNNNSCPLWGAHLGSGIVLTALYFFFLVLKTAFYIGFYCFCFIENWYLAILRDLTLAIQWLRSWAEKWKQVSWYVCSFVECYWKLKKTKQNKIEAHSRIYTARVSSFKIITFGAQMCFTTVWLLLSLGPYLRADSYSASLLIHTILLTSLALPSLIMYFFTRPDSQSTFVWFQKSPTSDS